MSASLCTCPDCHATLRLAENRVASKPIRCPKCKTVFTAVPEVEEIPETESGRGPRRRTDYAYEKTERRPRRRTRPVAKDSKSQTLAIVVGSVLVGVLLLAGGAWFVWSILYRKPEAVASAPAPGGAKPGAANPGVRAGAANPPALPNVPRGTQVGNLAVEIEGEDIDGKRFRLSDYQGKVVLLDFWGNW